MVYKAIALVGCATWFLCLSDNGFTQGVEPTAEEQLMLELINRARMNPADEGIRLANHTDREIVGAYNFFQIDRNQIAQDFSTYPVRAPLAFNMQLIEAARRHSQDMVSNNFQGHEGTDGSTLATRIDDSGYRWLGIAENVFAYANSVEYAHAGFVVDWGVPSLGHRKNTLEYDRDPFYVEVGIGVLYSLTFGFSAKSGASTDPRRPGVEMRQSQPVGPMVVTIDFAAPFNYTPQLLGVVYVDRNGNNFYDIDEGLDDVQVSVRGTGFAGQTWNSGGYSIPINRAGEYTVEISGMGIPPGLETSFVIDRDNVKVDFIITPQVHVEDWAVF